MSGSFTSVVSSKPLRFLITGCIDAWDPVTRELRIDHDQLWVAPGVSVMGLRAGACLHRPRVPGGSHRSADHDGTHARRATRSRSLRKFAGDRGPRNRAR